MKRTLLIVSISTAGLLVGAIADAKKKPKADTQIEKAPVEPPPAPLINPEPLPSVSVGASGSAPLPLLPGAAPPPPPPQMVVVGRRKYWEVAAAGGGVLGGAYVLSALVGALSYAGFYDGQWGWFVPVAGPALAMAGVGGEPAGCLSKAAFTYTLGPILTLIYLGGMATAITGAFVKKDVLGPAPGTPGAPGSPPPPPSLQLAPTVAPGGAGMLILGTF